ncbi:PRD domain-containing protein [Brevibacillus sp. 7WMA2]|uniref:BglG family transcription antiterminator LicT n=1 Tax=Brevibacillus TaxID=55080 RepID=UPI0002404733|nr:MULTISPECIES: PRD domain-containing protein [Brevibacillus]AYK07064.1 PRD domain-containing protein [Brevibacillus laterosporus]ERM19879.1 transcription antiterminator LicT [Brevibacillus laterosporus PE36]MBA4531269.1 PRD domain-containing protein [Brevibacillus halotolerans]MCR8962031.1 PRD domain-containing protein [Brevibacillus laterosporus]MCR8994123.1 PRD domain-containing protein [Brevibacillus laterosporus]
MKIAKVINNNVISVYNDQNKELVIMGRGIAFQKRPGDKVEEDKIEKIFKLENKDISEKFKTLLYEIPMEYMEISENIINYAKMSLGKKLNESIYVSLTDHIYFAIQRNKDGLDIKNALLWEIKRLYQDEFSVGQKAIKQINQKLGITLPEDEAGFIALHIVNAELNEEMPTIVTITKVMQEILNIVKYHFNIEVDEESLHYYRFITHLKFFAQRLCKETHMESSDDFLYEMVKSKYKEAYECTKKIKRYIQKEYKHELTNEEVLYLTIHIHRVVNKK